MGFVIDQLLNGLIERQPTTPHKMVRLKLERIKKERKNKQKMWLKPIQLKLHHPVPKEKLTWIFIFLEEMCDLANFTRQD